MKTLNKIVIILFLFLICFNLTSHAQDTLSVKKHVARLTISEPLKTTMMAVTLPGLGQIYNRKYWKIPLVYAGFGALIYSVGYNSSNYSTYIKAYQDFTDAIPETISYQVLIPFSEPKDYDPVLFPESYKKSDAAYYEDAMLRMVDHFKRYRDLSYIGIAAWYLISILDANVDASLMNYDVSNNLDIAIVPVQVPLPGGFLGAGANLSVKINF